MAKRLALLLALGMAEGRGQAVHCRLPEDLTYSVGESFHVDPACVAEAGKAYQYQWNPGDDRGDLPWSDTAGLRLSYAKPDFHPLVLKVRVDGVWNPANTFTTTVRVTGMATAGRPSHSSTIAYDGSRHVVWNVNADRGTVTAVDAKARLKLREIGVGGKPGCLALDGQGNVWVTVRAPASLVKVEAGTGSVSAVGLPYGSLPFGVVVDASRNFAYVSLEGTGRIAKVDLARRAVAAQAPVFPTPRALALDHRGERLYVARFHSRVNHSLAPDSSYGELAELSAGDLRVTHAIRLAYDRSLDSRLGGGGVPTQLRSLVIHPDGKKAWVTAMKANVFRGPVRSGTDFDPSGENTLRSMVAVIDLESREEKASLRFDLDNGAMPSAAAFTRDGMHGYVAMEGNNSVEILGGETLMDLGTIGPVEYGPEMAPDGVILSPDDSLLFVHNFTTRSLGIYDRARTGPTGGLLSLGTVPLVAEESLTPQQLKGLQVFYNAADPRVTKSGYISCAACHPDGGSDRLVWDFTGRGEGLRKTIPLKGRAGMGHGPVHWSANFDEIQDFEHDFRGPFAGGGLMPDAAFHQGTRNRTLGDVKAGHSEDLDALAAYVTSLASFDASPFRNQEGNQEGNQDGSMTPDALAGREIFHRPEVGCASCHSGPNLTDSDLRSRPFKLHDVGTLKPASGRRLNDTLTGLDTPTLLGIWQYPPYLHDGSAPTLMDVLTTRNPGDRHGKTSHLEERELGRLVAFLQQLDHPSDGSIPVRPSGGRAPGPSLRTILRNGTLEMRISLPPGPPFLSVQLLDVNGGTVARFPAHRSSDGYAAFWRLEGAAGISGAGNAGTGYAAGRVLLYRVMDRADRVSSGKLMIPP